MRALFLQNTSDGCFWNYYSFFTLKYTCVSKRRDVKNWLIRLLINQVLFSFKMKKHGSFAEMNMILITIPKAQLLSFLALIYWNILLLLKHFLLLLKPSDYGDNQQLVFISIYKCSNSLWALISALIASGLFLAFAYLRIFSSYFVVFFYRTHMQYSLNIVLPWI